MIWARFLLMTSLALTASVACAVVPHFQESKPAEPSGARAPLILLYDSIPDRQAAVKVRAMGVERWGQINQDPESYTTGIIDVDSILKQIESKTGGKPAPWMMLDFEEPFFADLNRPAESLEYKRAVKAMTGALRAVKLSYPDSKWSFYGLPNLSYWIDGKGWGQASHQAKEATLKKAADACVPVLADVDWVSVSIYEYYDTKMIVPGSPNSIRGTPESVRADGRAWRMAQVGLAKLLARGKPVIPTVFPYWAPGGVAPACRVLPPRQFMEEQIIPAVDAGATGFALWAGLSFRIDQVIDGGRDPAYVSKEKNFGIAEWRAAFTADYLNNVPPPNWRDPAVRSALVAGTSKTMVDSIANIRDWEKTGVVNLPPLK